MKKLKIVTFLLIFIILSISTVSATDLNDNFSSISQNYNNTNNLTNSISSESPNLENSNDMNTNISMFNTVSSSSKTVQVTENSYSNYFDENGNLLSSSGINDGDTIDLSGTFTNKNFIVKNPLTITSTSNTAILYNGTITIYNSGSGSSISNLKITNSNSDGFGIILYNAENNNIFNNNISVNGVGAMVIALNTGSNYNNISSNYLETKKTSEGKSHSTLVLGGANYNTIENNHVTNDGVNGIYLSYYGSGKFSGGYSYYNTIVGNTVTCLIDNPSSWNYAIQMMGSNNKAENNNVIGTYRGISSTGNNNSIINNNLTNIIGDYAISGSDDSLISGNTISSSTVSAGIYVLSNSNVTNNIIHVKGSTIGIRSAGDNIILSNNIITTVSGNGIYTMGDFSNIVITSNNISSNSGVDILIKKQSSTKYPKNLSITNNTVSTSAEYAIDARESDTSTIIKDNTVIGDGKIGLPSGTNSSGNQTDFNGTVYNINNDNFYKFFDSNGQIIVSTLKDGDTIIFSGKFTNKNLTLSSRLKILGNNAFFYNSTIKVTASGCDIEGLNIINNNPNAIDQWGIYINGASNVKIINNYINVTDNDAAYAIYIYDSSNDNVSYNTLISSGKYLTYTILTYEVSNTYIAHNNVYTNGTSEVHLFEPEACIDGVHNVPEIYSTYGILALYSSNNNITQNNVNVTSGLTKEYSPYNESTNSIVGIDIYYDSHNNTVDSNIIYLSSFDPFIYGTGVLGAQTNIGNTSAENNCFKNNNINIKGNYFVSGIITGYNSINTTIFNNKLTLNSNDYAYGITLEISQYNKVNENIVNINSSAVYVIEMFQSNNNTISSNKLLGNGNYVYGIAGYMSSDNLINSNNIQSLGNSLKNIESTLHSDAIPVGNSGIFLYQNSNSNNITNNIIKTTAVYAVNATTNTNYVIGNSLISANYTGDNAVNPKTNLVHDNYGNNSGNISTFLVCKDMVEVYGAGENFTGKLVDEFGDPIVGQHVALNLTRLSDGASKIYGVTTDLAGEFQLEINLFVGNYTASASYNGFSKDNVTYLPSSSSVASIQVVTKIDNRTSTVLSNKNFTEVYGAGQNFTGTLSDINGKSIIGQHVALNLTRLSDGASKIYWVTTDTAGEYQLEINLFAGDYTCLSSYDGNGVYQPSTSSLTSIIVTKA